MKGWKTEVNRGGIKLKKIEKIRSKRGSELNFFWLECTVKRVFLSFIEVMDCIGTIGGC